MAREKPFSNSNSLHKNLTAAVARRRFFFSSPGRSNSIVDSSAPPHRRLQNGGAVAVATYSKDPFADFRRSMQEMVEAREARGSWDYLHELLACYLSLNSKSTHKFIVEAFADLLVGIMAEDGGRKRRSPGG